MSYDPITGEILDEELEQVVGDYAPCRLTYGNVDTKGDMHLDEGEAVRGLFLGIRHPDRFKDPIVLFVPDGQSGDPVLFRMSGNVTLLGLLKYVDEMSRVQIKYLGFDRLSGGRTLKKFTVHRLKQASAPALPPAPVQAALPAPVPF